MAWIKRNLFFVIGAVVALALMGVAFFFLFLQYSDNDKATTELGEKYVELKRIIVDSKPFPSEENIKLAQDQQKQISNYIREAVAHFRPIPPIPNTGGRPVVDRQFANELRTTIEQLKRAAASASVSLPPNTNYGFTFEAQLGTLKFAKESLGPLSVQLGEIKAICDIIFAGRVNSLDRIARERVSADDPQNYTSYHDRNSVTNNELAVISPYEIEVRCFSAELGKLLAGFANSPYPLVVKEINIEHPIAAAAAPAYTLDPYRRPVWTSPGGRAGGRGGLTTVIDEAPIRVTMWVEVIKLKGGTK